MARVDKGQKPMEMVALNLPSFVAMMVANMPEEKVVEILRNGIENNQASLMADVCKEKEPSKPILQRANELIGEDTQKEYGNKLQNQAQIAMLMQGYLAPKLAAGQTITPEDACNLVICIKLARLSKQPDHEDSLLDIAGYAGVEEALKIERSQPDRYPMKGATVDAGDTRGIGIWPPVGRYPKA